MFDSDDDFQCENQEIDESYEKFLDKLPPKLKENSGKITDFKRVSFLAQGSFGRVFRAIAPDGTEVALKTLSLHQYSDRRRELAFRDSLREVLIIGRFNHPNVVAFKQLVVKDSSFYLAIEYCPFQLKQLAKRILPEGFVKAIMADLMTGLSYIHDQQLIHRDIKVDNLMLKNGQLKIADFGSTSSAHQVEWTPQVVTLWYRPPEILFGSASQSTAVDIWSAGCVFGELLQAKPLFAGNGEITQINLIVEMLGTPMPDEWPEIEKLPTFQCMALRNRKCHIDERILTKKATLQLLKKMLHYNPEQRCSAKHSLQDEYFSQEPSSYSAKEVDKFCRTKTADTSDTDRTRKMLKLDMSP